MKIVLLTVAGFALIILDLMLIPGTVFAVAGSAIILYSVYLNFLLNGLGWASAHLMACGAVIPFLVVWSLKRVALKEELTNEDGYVGVDDHSHLIGMTAVAASPLHPSGSVTMVQNGMEIVLDCITNGSYIEKGTTVLILECRGPYLVVGEIVSSQEETGS